MSAVFKLFRVLTPFIVVSLISSCASSQPRTNVVLTQEAASKIKAVQVHLAASSEQSYSLTQSVDTSASHMNAQSSGNLFADIIGHAIAESLIQSTGKVHVNKKDPLLDFTKNIKFSEMYSESFQNVLASSSWLHVKGFSQSNTSLTPESRLEMRKSLGEVSVLFGDARYYFSGDYRRVYVATDLELWLNGESSAPLYSGAYLFCSKPVGSDLDSIESYLKAWSANNNALLRKTLNLGISETRRMLSIGLNAPTDNTSQDRANEIQLIGCARTVTVKGEVIFKDNNRSIVMSDIGNYYSVPSVESHPDNK